MQQPRYMPSVSDLYGTDEIEFLLEEIRDLEPACCQLEDIQVHDDDDCVENSHVSIALSLSNFRSFFTINIHLQPPILPTPKTPFSIRTVAEDFREYHSPREKKNTWGRKKLLKQSPEKRKSAETLFPFFLPILYTFMTTLSS